jgi:hypothetical protein
MTRTNIEIMKIDSQSSSTIYKQSIYTDPTANLCDSTRYPTEMNSFLCSAPPILNYPGIYNITASTPIDGKIQSAWKLIEVHNIYNSTTAYAIYIAIIFFVGLIIVITFRKINYTLSEVLRFIFISGIIVSVILSFIFIDEPVGSTSPVGLIQQSNATSSSSQWMI